MAAHRGSHSTSTTDMSMQREPSLRQRAAKALSAIRAAAIETLEPRQLLTTMNGGDTYTYQDPGGDIVQITLQGGSNTAAELIGATSDPGNNLATSQSPALGQIPGRLVRANGQV